MSVAAIIPTPLVGVSDETDFCDISKERAVETVAGCFGLSLRNFVIIFTGAALLTSDFFSLKLLAFRIFRKTLIVRWALI